MTTAGAGRAVPAEAAQHAGKLLVAAVGQARHPHQRAGESGDLRLGAWAVGP